MPGLEAYLHPGDVVVDVGANVGRLTKRYATIVGPTGCVIACEPLPASAAHLRHAIAAFTQVLMREIALDATAGSRDLIEGLTSTQCSFWDINVPKDKKHGHTRHRVQTTTLDALLADRPRVHGIKIDAQGAEVAILRGAIRTLQRPETVWMLELWPLGLTGAGSSVADLVDVLEAADLQPIAEGKDPVPRAGLTWAMVRTRTYTGHSHTNIICRH